MIVKTEEKVECKDCGEPITLREYFGIEGGWYTDHHCEVLTEGVTDEPIT